VSERGSAGPCRLIPRDPRVSHLLLQGLYLVIYIAVTMMVILMRVFPTGVFSLTELADTNARDDMYT
jgi:hypothetical protein